MSKIYSNFPGANELTTMDGIVVQSFGSPNRDQLAAIKVSPQ